MRSWGFVRGGIGTRHRAAGRRGDAKLGAEIRDRRRGLEVIVRRRARRTAYGWSTVGSSTPIWCCPTPTRTAPSRACPRWRAPRSRSTSAIRAYRIEGTSMKITLGVSGLPHVRGLGEGVQPYHRGIMEISGWLVRPRPRHRRRPSRAFLRTTHTLRCASQRFTTRR